MIPLAFITSWRAKAPWPDDYQVEQDLVLSRALVDIFSSDAGEKLAPLELLRITEGKEFSL